MQLSRTTAVALVLVFGLGIIGLQMYFLDEYFDLLRWSYGTWTGRFTLIVSGLAIFAYKRK